MSTMCRGNNADINSPTTFFNDHFGHGNFFLSKLSSKANINHIKIANHIEHGQKYTHLIF